MPGSVSANPSINAAMSAEIWRWTQTSPVNLAHEEVSLGTQQTSQSSITVRSGQVLVLFASFVGLWFGLPMGLSKAGVGQSLKQAGLGDDAFQYVLIVLGLAILVLIVMAIRRTNPLGALKEIGLMPFSLRAILVSLLAVALMVAILCVCGRSPQITALGSLLAFGVVGPFAEEIVFRGFFFRQFRRWVGMPFWLAVLLSSTLFGLVHYGQGHTLTASLEVIGVTFVGGVLFCWLTERWGNLWAAIVLHAGLDLVWTIFHFADNAVGDLLANEARLAAVAVAIASTLAFTQLRRKVTLEP